MDVHVRALARDSMEERNTFRLPDFRFQRALCTQKNRKTLKKTNDVCFAGFFFTAGSIDIFGLI